MDLQYHRLLLMVAYDLEQKQSNHNVLLFIT